MAELEDAPWAKKEGSGSDLPDAPWSAPTWTDEAVDLAKAAIPSVGRGIVATATTPATIRDAVTSGADWAIGKVSPSTLEHIQAGRKKMEEDQTLLGKLRQYTEMPSYGTAMNKIEGVTGPWYNAKYLPGRVGQGALETAPSLLAGGGSALVNTIRALGAGIGGEGGRQIGQAVSGSLPESWQPYAAPVGNVIGNIAGAMGGPRAAARPLTPLPVSDERLALINAHPEIAKAGTAGQVTDRNWLRQIEAGSKKGQAAPKRQEEAFTKETTGLAGVTGEPWKVNDPNNIVGSLRSQGNARDVITNANAINTAELNALNAANQARVPGLMGASPNLATDKGLEAYLESRRDISRGPTRNLPNPGPFPTDIPGPRYQGLRGSISGKIGSTEGAAQQALRGMKSDLDKAWINSLSPADRANYERLSTQMQHGYALRDIPPKVGRTTATPQEVFSSAGTNNPALQQHAQEASQLMPGMPAKVSSEAPPGIDLAATAAGLLIPTGGESSLAGIVPHGGGGSAEHAVAAHLASGPLWATARKLASGPVMFPPVQKLLKNQAFRPSANTAIMDPRAAISALRGEAPEVYQRYSQYALPNQEQ